MKIFRDAKGQPDQSPVSSKQYSVTSIDETIAASNDESISEESFLEMEKICEKTLHLNNESAQLMDLTSMNDTNNRQSLTEESRLDCIEAPSFFSNSSLMSPGTRYSPRNGNRPSTILEVSETTTNRTAMSSYKTARTTTTGTDVSFRTAADLTNATDSTCQNSHISIDSLDPSQKSDKILIDLTRDSLNGDYSDSGLNSEMCENNETTDRDDSEIPEFNDTLERIEYILNLNERANAMKEEQESKLTSDDVKTPEHACLLDLPITPNRIVASKLTPQQPHKKIGNRLTPKNSPFIRFSPANGKSPANRSPAAGAFKKPVSATKTPAPFLPISKRYQHIQSPIASYIKQTPGAPGSYLAGKTVAGITRLAKTPDFRDSDLFANENEPTSSRKLAHVAKTGSSTKVSYWPKLMFAFLSNFCSSL